MEQKEVEKDKKPETVEATVKPIVENTRTNSRETVEATVERTVEKDSKEKASKKGAEKGASQQAEQVKAEAKKETKDQEPSQGPTEAKIRKWIKENPFECDYPGCDYGEEGRPYRHHHQGTINTHKYNKHGVESEDKRKEKKEKKKAKGGEVDMVEEVGKRIDKVTLRGRISKAINRVSKVPKDKRENLEVERTLLLDWKTRSFQTEVPLEELQRYEAELISSIIPAIEDIEAEVKEEEAKKKSKAEKKSRRAEDDDDEDMLGVGDLKSEVKSMKYRDQIEEMREDREARRRRRDKEEERRDQEHQKRMQMMDSGSGLGGIMGRGNPMGMVYERVITFKHDEDGNVLIDENGQPIPESMREIPMNPNAIVPSRGRGGDDGGTATIKLLKTAVDLVKGDDDKKDDVLKELREERKVFMDKITQLTSDGRDKEIYGNMNKLAGAIDGINKKLEEDPMDAYIKMQERMKEHNIYPDGSSSPEVRKIDLEIERELTRRDTDLKMMSETFKIAETAITKISDGPMAKAFAKKIDQSDVIAEEEELPEDEALEAEIEEEVAPPQPQEQPPPENPTRGKGKRGKRKR